MRTTTKAPQPEHIHTEDRIRILVWRRKPYGDPRATILTIERNQGTTTESWYPAASFSIADLASLNKATDAVRTWLEAPSAKTGTKAPASGTAPPAAPPMKNPVGPKQAMPEERAVTPPANASPTNRNAVTSLSVTPRRVSRKQVGSASGTLNTGRLAKLKRSR